MEKTKGSFEVVWRLVEGRITITVDGQPRYRVNLGALVEPDARKVRDAIMSAVEHKLSERFGLLPGLDNRPE